MKLRSESFTLAASETPIAFVLPATHAITISNADSPLLRLPQELKDRIYQFVYGGKNIHVVNTSRPTSMRLSTFEYFDHRRNGAPIASLGTCRQMYHDAKGVFYSANVFHIRYHVKPVLDLFIQHLDCVSYRVLAVRDMDLEVRITNRKEERQWDNGFCALAESVKNLRDISIDVRIPDYANEKYRLECQGRMGPAYRQEPFLVGLLELKKLPLKTFSLSVYVLDDVPTDSPTWRAVKIREWVQPVKGEWVQHVKGAVLGSD
ncbi:hypothetical protein BDR22DRAFT_889947 [Usnea florida]